MTAGVHVSLVGMSKSYSGIRALHDVSLDLREGEIHALIGENGAGKSTLIKIMAGAVKPDAGQIQVDGEPVVLHSPHHANKLGLAFIHQDPSLVGDISLAENMFLGTEEFSNRGLTSQRALRRRFREIAARLQLDCDPHQLARRTPLAKQTLVAIGRAIALDASVIVLDEPTSTFSDVEAESLFRVISDLTSQGKAILYVSHRLEEVHRLADRVTVLRNGAHVVTMPKSEIQDKAHLVSLIVGERAGRRLAEVGHREAPEHFGDVRLVARNVGDGARVVDASLEIRAGEIVALTGLVGSGRTELAKVLFGASALRTGTIEVDGEPFTVRNPRQAIKGGLALVPEERRSEGLIMSMSLKENATLPTLDRYRLNRLAPIVRTRREGADVRDLFSSLSVKYSSVEQPVRQLSGGNQQKVSISKWAASDAGVIICDEPTQGVDVGAKSEIYTVIRELAARGAAVLMITSEISEALEQSDRVLVMREGRIVADLVDPTEHDVLRWCYDSHGDTSTVPRPDTDQEAS